MVMWMWCCGCGDVLHIVVVVAEGVVVLVVTKGVVVVVLMVL